MAGLYHGLTKLVNELYCTVDGAGGLRGGDVSSLAAGVEEPLTTDS